MACILIHLLYRSKIRNHGPVRQTILIIIHEGSGHAIATKVLIGLQVPKLYAATANSPAVYARANCANASKCASRANNTSECCRVRAATHMSLVGIGVSCLRNWRNMFA